jgi:DNA (cytosine-5)-methyltransferase 1
MRFIDLFAGLGGFHKALHELGHECVFVSELDPALRVLYKTNWGIEPQGDIKKIVEKDIDSIPPHDILCAGFPCQPFSKAGKQAGRNDLLRGTLFDEIIKILAYRKPAYFILENVRYIRQHDNEETWKYMHKKLTDLGYEVDHEIYSPQDFGIPQHRQRVFIVGSLIGLDHFSFDEVDEKKIPLIDIHQFIEENPIQYKQLPKANQDCLALWQKFIYQIPKETMLPRFPIWGMEFGATYPFERSTPSKLSSKNLGEFKGNFGCNLSGLKKKEQIACLPSYARVKKAFPEWKRNYIRLNREFYIENLSFIKNVVDEIAKYPSQSWQKLEWNVGDGARNINDYILQFRASGIRIKKVDFFPSLVCTSTQIPIIGWQNRYITRLEGLKLQSLEGLELPSNDNAAYKALGNAVNSKIVKFIAENLLSRDIPAKNLVNPDIIFSQNIQTNINYGAVS